MVNVLPQQTAAVPAGRTQIAIYHAPPQIGATPAASQISVITHTAHVQHTQTVTLPAHATQLRPMNLPVAGPVNKGNVTAIQNIDQHQTIVVTFT